MPIKTSSNVSDLDIVALQTAINALKLKIVKGGTITAADITEIQNIYNQIASHTHTLTETTSLSDPVGSTITSGEVKGRQVLALSYAKGNTIVQSANNAIINAVNWLRTHTHEYNDNPIIPILTYTLTSTPSFVSGCGGNVWTPALDLSLYVPPQYLYTGRQFRVTTKLLSCTGWQVYPTLVGTFTYGTGGTVQSPYIYRKQFFMRIHYTANNTIQGQGFYSGDSTNSPYGGLYINTVEFI